MNNLDPFGKISCEQEVKIIGDEKYTKLYFDEAPFNEVAINTETYLIIGRRGSGKLTLARYFTFQDQIKDPICIEILEAKVYARKMLDISRRTSTNRTIAIPNWSGSGNSLFGHL